MVKEEIIIVNDSLDLLNYVVIQERSDYNLDLFVESSKFKNRVVEQYSAEKLAYYFF